MSKDLPTDILQQYQEAGITHLYVAKHDTEEENLLDVFGELCLVIEEKLRGSEGGGEKQGVLVHCAMGISRSVSVVLAYGSSATPIGFPPQRQELRDIASRCPSPTPSSNPPPPPPWPPFPPFFLPPNPSPVMQRYGISRSEAKRLVRSKRNVANPNAGFYRQLKVWEACRYDIHTLWSVDGVRQLKMEYRAWLGDVEEEKRKRERESEARGGEEGEEEAGRGGGGGG